MLNRDICPGTVVQRLDEYMVKLGELNWLLQ